MAAIPSDEFKRDAVRIATTSGLTRRQVASDLGVGLSTLNKWVKMVSDAVGPYDPDQSLRRKVRILKEAAGRPKNRHGSQPACARYKQPVRPLVA